MLTHQVSMDTSGMNVASCAGILLPSMFSAVMCLQEALQGRCAMAAISAVFSAVAAAAEIATGPPDPDRYVASPLLLSPEVCSFRGKRVLSTSRPTFTSALNCSAAV